MDKTLNKEKPKKYEERLMIAFAFDEDDLEANRSGYLSQDQFIRLKKSQNGTLLTLAIVSFVTLILFPVFFAWSLNVAIALLALVAALGIVGFVYALNIHNLRNDLRENEVCSAEGRIEISDKHEQNGIKYFLRVDKRRFSIKKEKYFALKNGDPYRIYYTPHTKRITSVEWLREGNDDFMEDARGEDESEALNIEFAPPDEKPKRLMQ